jgi:5-methylcytosine-specific restriction endonuclease McrBC GTP-binding regulatory subunit McrB
MSVIDLINWVLFPYKHISFIIWRNLSMSSTFILKLFIIDEINRGEISKIFGELFFSIDPGYRGTNGRVKTQYQNLVEEDDVFYDGFYVPENVYIIGTMNDIDRSVESMDFAFRRRFAFKEVTAEESQQMLDSDSAWGKDEKGNSRKPSDGVISDIKERMDKLNEAICPDKKDSNKKGIEGLSSAYHIGASYFLKLSNYKNGEDS